MPRDSGQPIIVGVAAIGLHDALEFFRIIFDQVQILVRQLNAARAAMFLELGKCDQHEFGGSADFAILAFTIMRDQFVEECLGFFPVVSW